MAWAVAAACGRVQPPWPRLTLSVFGRLSPHCRCSPGGHVAFRVPVRAGPGVGFMRCGSWHASGRRRCIGALGRRVHACNVATQPAPGPTSGSAMAVPRDMAGRSEPARRSARHSGGRGRQWVCSLVGAGAAPDPADTRRRMSAFVVWLDRFSEFVSLACGLGHLCGGRRDLLDRCLADSLPGAPGAVRLCRCALCPNL
jgi:hypothetical protein